MVVVPYALAVLLLFMLINTSGMFKFHMLIAIVAMFNILKLIMKIVFNYPTNSSNIPLKYPSSQRSLKTSTRDALSIWSVHG
jgi:hypothetical protein